MRTAGRFAGAALACALTATAIIPSATAEDVASADGQAIYLVVLDGAGTAGSPNATPAEMLADQAATRDRVGGPAALYSWTTALNGYAARLNPLQATVLAALPGVARVERDTVHRLASTPGVGAASPTFSARTAGPGRGVVVGVVDTGIDPDGPVFADSGRLGRRPASFTGTCVPAERWSADDCSEKVVAAHHYVVGFGADRLRTGAALSPHDDDGHGTQVASLAVGNADVSAHDGDEMLGRFGGVAPDARLAVYKACWAAPDPADDGCAASDLVAAIDQAVADGVDVLFLATDGPTVLDTVDLALLGAAEADVFVAAAAGNGGAAAHAQPWLTTVGSTTGPVRAGRLTLSDGTSVTGVMTSRKRVPARLVNGADVAAPGFRRGQARLCRPGSLDAARVAGRIVVCQRGTIARVDKSGAVALADGVGMVLVNRPGQDLAADFHAVPTLHVRAADGRRLVRALRADDRLGGQLTRVPAPARPARIADWSPRGPAIAVTVKPDVLAPGTALLSATSPVANGRRWDLISGSSASTALVAGLAARMRSAHPHWSAGLIRSALITTATAIQGGVTALRQGAGLVAPDAVTRPGLGYDVPAGRYRQVLVGRGDSVSLNLPSILAGAEAVVHRSVTNLGHRAMYWSSRARGFSRHRVIVTPAAIRVAPGETVRYTVRIARLPGVRPSRESGWVTWLAADGTRARIPVVVGQASRRWNSTRPNAISPKVSPPNTRKPPQAFNGSPNTERFSCRPCSP